MGDRKFSNNFATQYAIFNPEGYDSLNNGSYSNFVFEAQRLPKNYINLRRSDAELGFRDTLDIAFMDEGKRKLLDILGVRYLAVEGDDRKIVSKFDGFIKVFEQGKVAIFKNETAFDRAFFSSDWQEINKDDVFRDGKIEITSYTPSIVQMKTNSPEAKFLILTDNYYSGWKAKVDGQKAEIFKASSTFRAVEIGSGTPKFYYLTAASRDYELTIGSSKTEKIEITDLGKEIFAGDFIGNYQKRDGIIDPAWIS